MLLSVARVARPTARTSASNNAGNKLAAPRPPTARFSGAPRSSSSLLPPTRQASFGALALSGAAVAGLTAVAAWAWSSAGDDDEHGVRALKNLGASLPWSLAMTADAAGVPLVGVPGTNNERTFITIKPDGVQRGLISEIIHRFEAKGFKLVGIKMVQPTKKFAEEHYADLAKRPFFPGLVTYFSSGPVVAMVWEGRNVITTGRAIIGATNPDAAAPGSIRGDLCIQTGRNIIHGSDSPAAAAHELSLWFKENEIVSWDSANAKWLYEQP